MASAGVPAAEVAVIGGSGFYELLDDAVEIEPETPYGPASSPVAIGLVGETRVAFIARHGTRHTLPPHRINFRANLWALRDLGVRRIIGPCAVGSLRADVRPGDFMVLDQLVDRTWGRPDTFLDGPAVEHVAFADPYCAELSSVVAAAAGPEVTMHARGTVAVINGPRFSTRAESTWFRRAGWDVVNMTQFPEAYLARELGLCYAGLALVTDYDTGVDDEDPGLGAESEAVTMEAVLAVLADNVQRTRQLLFDAIPAIPTGFACTCARSGAPSLRRDR
ncbi:MAG: S-methyl-5'-thioadenosine phosphorylase [Actinomycetota bacterium]|nr:S-methyl-5'-thioadenosine phosphorylase [Actinomycetota bacterium]